MFSLQNFYLVLCPGGVHFGNQCRDIQTIVFIDTWSFLKENRF